MAKKKSKKNQSRSRVVKQKESTVKKLDASKEISTVDLSGANLAGANLTGANLQGANFTGANLCGANLVGADLSGVDFSSAIGFPHQAVKTDQKNVTKNSKTCDETDTCIKEQLI